jgi:hypothetical protein
MSMFIKLLVYRMRTLDGNKGSAEGILKAMNKQEMKNFLKSRKDIKSVPESRQHQIMAMNEFKVFKKVCMKYTVMKIRSKISFIAMME